MRTVIHYVDNDSVGGTERVALQVLTSLDRQRWRPVLFHHGSAELAPMLAEATACAVETRVVPRILTVHGAARLPAFIRAIRRERPSVLHAHLSWPLSCKYGLLAAALARVPAVVATAHLYFDVSALPVVAMQPRFIARLVDRYLAVSSGVARQLVDEFKIPGTLVEILRNGIDLSRYTGSRDARLRAELTGDVDRPIVLTVARLDRQKGLHDLLDAVPLVPEALFVVAGDGPERTALEAQARAHGIQERVRFLGRRDDVAALLSIADLFVLPSLYEGLPLSVMEAMAAGTAVVATNIRGTDEVVVSGETGLLVPVANPSALAEGLRALLGDPVRRNRLASAASARVAREFDVTRVARRVSAVYDELLAGHS